MRRFLRAILYFWLTSIGILLLAVFGLYLFHRYSLDGLDGEILATAHDRTIYASAYSERNFRRIEHRMSMADVRSLLGDPLIKRLTCGGGQTVKHAIVEYDRVLTNPNSLMFQDRAEFERRGLSMVDGLAACGLITMQEWEYTKPEKYKCVEGLCDGRYRHRSILFYSDAKVDSKHYYFSLHDSYQVVFVIFSWFYRPR